MLRSPALYALYSYSYISLLLSIGIVLESEDGAQRRFIHDHAHAAPLAAGEVPRPLRLKPFCCRLLGKGIDSYSVYTCLCSI